MFGMNLTRFPATMLLMMHRLEIVIIVIVLLLFMSSRCGINDGQLSGRSSIGSVGRCVSHPCDGWRNEILTRNIFSMRRGCTAVDGKCRTWTWNWKAVNVSNMFNTSKGSRDYATSCHRIHLLRSFVNVIHFTVNVWKSSHDDVLGVLECERSSPVEAETSWVSDVEVLNQFRRP